MTLVRQLFLSFIVIASLVSSHAFSQEKQDRQRGVPGASYFERGAITLIESFKVDQSGGTFIVDHGSSPLKGLKITVPAGALDKMYELSVGFDSGVLHVNNTRSKAAEATIMVTLRGDDGESGTTEAIDDAINIFQLPHAAAITVPYFQTEVGVPVPYYVDADGQLSSTQLVSIDKEHHTFTFETFHAGRYTWIYALNSPG